MSSQEALSGMILGWISWTRGLSMSMQFLEICGHYPICFPQAETKRRTFWESHFMSRCESSITRTRNLNLILRKVVAKKLLWCCHSVLNHPSMAPLDYMSFVMCLVGLLIKHLSLRGEQFVARKKEKKLKEVWCDANIDTHSMSGGVNPKDKLHSKDRNKGKSSKVL